MGSFLFISRGERLKSKGLLLVCHQRNCTANVFTGSEEQQLHKFAIGKGALPEFVFTWRINGWPVLRQVGDHDISRTSGFNFYERALVTTCTAEPAPRFIRYGAEDPVAGTVNYDR